ncbi:S9 family peptidase [Flavobacteriaceae bacterium]|nr:S9 family peptidase [Flavobacteriaceae bacterium]
MIFVFSACKNKIEMNFDTSITAPIADRSPYQLKKHGNIRIDDYYWMKERENPEVIDYLERENDYYNKMTKSSKSFQENLFEELKGRIKNNDESVPYFFNGYWYITRFEDGNQYPIYLRKKDSIDAMEEIIFDCNLMSKGYDYFRLVGMNVSPDNSKVIYGIDTESRRKYTLYVKDLITGEVIDTNIKNTSGGSAWSTNSKNFFYVYKNPITLRSEKIFRHDTDFPHSEDPLVFHEKDETFSISVSESKSLEYIFINSHSTLTSEVRFIKSDEPLSKFQLIQKRTTGLEYSVNQFEDHFYIVNNKDNSFNYKISKVSITDPTYKNWVDIMEHRESVLIEDLNIFKDYWVVTEREQGLTKLRVQSWDGFENYFIPVEGETYDIYTGLNPSFNTTKLRYGFTSLKTPSSVLEFDMLYKNKKLLKQKDVIDNNFDIENYIEKRVFAESRDGISIPISLIYKKDIDLNPETPLLLYAYGSYGYTTDPSFSSNRLSLLDRGFIFAIAHVRGGEYLGRQWYEKGKLLTKKNTFNDFIDVSKFLIDKGYTSAKHLHALGGSAGGLLMGVILNEAPELYRSVISAVPFVDVVTTMLDDNIPLTTGEYDEWGNPNAKEYYDYMLSYSPYDNVKHQKYPNILVTAGYHDSQVQYWEPAKWVAKLRRFKKDNNALFLITNMDSGHSGASGRYNSLVETSKEYAFILQLEGRAD